MKPGSALDLARKLEAELVACSARGVTTSPLAASLSAQLAAMLAPARAPAKEAS